MVETQRKGLEQDIITYITLFIAYAGSEDNAGKALQLLVEMRRKGLEQDLITYITLIIACAVCEDNAEKALQLLGRCCGRAWSRT